MVHDLWGHTATGGHDLRPWLDHGHWPHTMPLAPRPGPSAGSPEPPEFLSGSDDALMQLPLGPIHGAIGEPAHLRLTARDDRVLRAESRLGYAHKGTLLLLRGKSPRAAVRFAARLSADATVAHALAFAHAAEAASDASAAAPSRRAARADGGAGAHRRPPGRTRRAGRRAGRRRDERCLRPAAASCCVAPPQPRSVTG